jgi:hypothetical protein
MDEFKTTRREFTKILVGGAGLQFAGFALSGGGPPGRTANCGPAGW